MIQAALELLTQTRGCADPMQQHASRKNSDSCGPKWKGRQGNFEFAVKRPDLKGWWRKNMESKKEQEKKGGEKTGKSGESGEEKRKKE